MIELVKNFRKVRICGFSVVKVQSTFEKDKPSYSEFTFINDIQILVSHSFSVDEAIVFMEIEMRKRITSTQKQRKEINWMSIPIIMDKDVPKGEVWVAPNSSLKTKDGYLTKEILSSDTAYESLLFEKFVNSNKSPKVSIPVSLGKETQQWPPIKTSFFGQQLRSQIIGPKFDDLEKENDVLTQETLRILEENIYESFRPEKKPEQKQIEYDPIERLADILNEDE